MMIEFSSSQIISQRGDQSRGQPRSIFHRALNRLKPYRRQLRSHFLFDANGQRVAYCYIRKNACSAFKAMILDQAGFRGGPEEAIAFLMDERAPSAIDEVRSATWRVFVYRDPVDRLTSLFRNKMIMEDGAADFLANYRRVTGNDPANADFEQFVTNYLTRRGVDKHAYSQAAHLLPVTYNMVSTLDTLFNDMKVVVGENLATRYFRQRVNRSSALMFDEPSSNMPVHVLRKRYARTGQLPSASALATDQLEGTIRRIYRADYELAPLAHTRVPVRG